MERQSLNSLKFLGNILEDRSHENGFNTCMAAKGSPIESKSATLLIVLPAPRAVASSPDTRTGLEMPE